MLTRCPRCDTTFRVTPEQLKARHGRVRCGHCQNVFDALETLIDAVPQTAPAPTVPAPGNPYAAIPEGTAEPRVTVAARNFDEAANEPIGDIAPPDAEVAVPEAPDEAAAPTAASSPDAAPVEPTIAPSASPVEAEPAEAEPAIEPVAGAVPEAIAESESAAAESSIEAEAAPRTPPPLEPLLHEAPKKRVWPWAIAAVLALLALLVQAAIHFRTEIAVVSPAAKPLLEALCEPIGCDVPLPHKVDLVGIETSNLSPADGKLVLSATLRNRAPFAQQYPDLELTLTDTNDQALLRRILVPADYLPPKTDVAAGFPANTVLSVNMLIEAPGVPASGYQLYLFYP